MTTTAEVCQECRVSHGGATHQEIVSLIRGTLCESIPASSQPRQSAHHRCEDCGKPYTNQGSLSRHQNPSGLCLSRMGERVRKHERERATRILVQARRGEPTEDIVRRIMGW